MATYKLSQNEEKPKKPSIKRIIGIILVVLSSVAFLSLFTRTIGFLRSFLLGVFGLSAYPFFIVLFIVGIALINKRKYVMSRRYVISLSMAIVSVLSIIDLALRHNFEGGYGQWLAYSYQHKMTAGGFLIGFVTAPFRYLIFEAGAYVVFSILFIVAVGLIIDYFRFAKNYKEYKKPVKLVQQQTTEEPVEVIMSKRRRHKEKQEQPKIVLDAEIEKNEPELTAKEKLGLVKNGTVATSANITKPQPPITQRTSMSDTEKVAQGKMSIKEYLLTKPTNIDLNYYRRDVQSASSASSQPIQQNINQTIEDLKNEPQVIVQNQYKPEKIVHDEFVDYQPLNNYVSPVQESKTYEGNNSQNNKVSDDVDEVPMFDDDDIIEDSSSTTAMNELENKVLESLNNPNTIMDINAPSANVGEGRRRERFVNLNNIQELKNEDKPQPKQENLQSQPVQPITAKPNRVYKTPPMDIFTTESVNLDELNDDMAAKKVQLEYTLETFNVPAKVIAVTIGPAVSRYELEMPVGISVKKILAHSDDIALSLAANGDIRIEAPIPGKSAVGIEVPNDRIATVGLKEILTSKEFANAKSPLTVALGKDISGEIKLCDITKMPHLLVAGATNSGKSVCLNAIILSLIARNSPEELKLILIDPKRVEFTLYNDLPHLVMPKVITETDKAVNALNYCVVEMERRYVVLQENRCRNIGEYNECENVTLGKAEKMPYLVLIVDELADLMMMAKKDVEEKVLRLAQKARAVGIHVILATQRPSVDVITGTIKANFPSRISFALTSFSDSNTILAQGGAEKLLGKGDMLYLPSDASSPRRIQGCFMTGTEVYNYVQYIKDNNEYDFDAEVEMKITAPKQSNVSELLDGKKENDYDDLMPQALKLVIENGQASASILQRKLLIGYPRASRIIDQMENAGYISPSDGSKPRSVYITMEEWESKFKRD